MRIARAPPAAAARSATRARCGSLAGPGSMITQPAPAAPRTRYVFVPGPVMSEGFGASRHSMPVSSSTRSPHFSSGSTFTSAHSHHHAARNDRLLPPMPAVPFRAPTGTEDSLTPSGGVRKTHGVWRGLLAGNEQCRRKADGGDDDDRNERRAVALVFREEWRDQNRAYQCGSKRGSQIRDAARQAGYRPLVLLGKARLDDVDRGGQHDANACTHQQQAGDGAEYV